MRGEIGILQRQGKIFAVTVGFQEMEQDAARLPVAKTKTKNKNAVSGSVKRLRSVGGKGGVLRVTWTRKSSRSLSVRTSESGAVQTPEQLVDTRMGGVRWASDVVLCWRNQ